MAKEDEIAYLKKINRNFPVIECTLETISKEKEEVRQIMLDKLKEMAEIKFYFDGSGSNYARICSAMNEIARTLLNK